jgi:hypothetical protein
MNAALLKKKIEPVREEIINHSLYSRLRNLNDLQVFASYHVFAVWDFMSLLKKLQQELTCVSTPWLPKGSASTRYLINEIVLGEESDIDPKGDRISHFELYLQAMKYLGAPTAEIDLVIEQIQAGAPVAEALKKAKVPDAAVGFCKYTFDLIENAPAHVLAAVFTFGREDLIPDMFHELVSRLADQYPEKIALFKYYLERHIEVDGDHHSMLAVQMVEELCGNDEWKWQEAADASVSALQERKRLWDGILNELKEKSVNKNRLSV